MHLFRFEEFFDPMRAEFTSMAALLVPAPRRFDIAWLHGVHPNDPGPQRLDRPQTAEDVARPNGSRQTIWSVIGDLKSLVVGLERNAGHHWTEDFFACDSSFVIGFEHRGLKKVSVLQLFRGRPPAARNQFGFFATDVDIALDLCQVFFAD